MRGEFGEVEVARNVAVAQAQNGLDEAGHSCGSLQVTQVRLHRAEHQRRRIGPVGEYLTQRLEFDRVTQRCAGAVRLDVVDVAGRQPRRRQRLAQQRLLCRSVGNGDTTAGPVLIDRRTPHDRQDAVAVTLGVFEAFEYHHPASLASDVTVCGGIEGLALPILGEHAPPRAGDAGTGVEQQIGAGHQCGVALPAPEALAGQVDRRQ